MLHYLREGTRQPSSKLLRKIEEIEVESGLARVGHVTDTENKGEFDQSVMREQSGAPNVPTPGNPTPATVQSLETRLAAVEQGIAEILKLLKEIRKATKEG